MQEVPHKEEMIKIIEIYFPQAKIYLFGSYAQGTHTPGSDIDIAIDIGRRLSLKELQNPARLLEALPIAQKIDLVDMNRIPDAMRNAILKEGIAWKN